MSEEKKEGNMALWNRRMKTDERHTKRVRQRGGFTAVDAQYQMMIATEEWGPYGRAWGIRDGTYGMIRDSKGEPLEMFFDAEFYYPGGSFAISTDCAWSPGLDSRKKLLTDVTTKALSKLGFNADVFMGRFDGNKYVWGEDGEYLKEARNGGRSVPERKASQEQPSNGLSVKKNALIASVADWCNTDSKGAVDEIKEIIATIGLENGESMDEERVNVIRKWVQRNRDAGLNIHESLEREKNEHER